MSLDCALPKITWQLRYVRFLRVPAAWWYTLRNNCTLILALKKTSLFVRVLCLLVFAIKMLSTWLVNTVLPFLKCPVSQLSDVFLQVPARATWNRITGVTWQSTPTSLVTCRRSGFRKLFFSTWENKTIHSPAFHLSYWPGLTITSLQLVGLRTCPCSSETNARPSPVTRWCVIDIRDERSVIVPLFLQFMKTNLTRGSVKRWVCDTDARQRNKSARFAHNFCQIAVRAFKVSSHSVFSLESTLYQTKGWNVKCFSSLFVLPVRLVYSPVLQQTPVAEISDVCVYIRRRCCYF